TSCSSRAIRARSSATARSANSRCAAASATVFSSSRSAYARRAATTTPNAQASANMIAMYPISVGSASGHTPVSTAPIVHAGASSANARIHSGRAQLPAAYNATSEGSDWNRWDSCPVASHSGYATLKISTTSTGLRRRASSGRVFSASNARSRGRWAVSSPPTANTVARNTAASTTATASSLRVESIILGSWCHPRLPHPQLRRSRSSPARYAGFGRELFLDRREHEIGESTRLAGGGGAGSVGAMAGSDRTIRDATAQDAAACAAIYAPYVTGTAISFEETPPTTAEMAGRIAAAARTHAWLVLTDGGEVVGFAYGGPFHSR